MTLKEGIDELNEYVDHEEALTTSERELLLSFISGLSECTEILDDN